MKHKYVSENRDSVITSVYEGRGLSPDPRVLRAHARFLHREAAKLEACPGHALASPPARGTDCEGSSPSQSVR
jgi:hypothetical protein